MADNFNFELVSPERLLLSEMVTEVVIPATEGEMTVMAHHAPTMTTIKAWAAHAAGDPAAGKRAFLKCASCHQLGSPHSGFGPHLYGIIGRPAAAATDFRYSDAMRNSRIVWSEAKLREFLKAPSKTVPT